jgi:hypothetical protein
MKLTIEQAIKQAKQDPNSLFARKLRKDIESGRMDIPAQKQGVDLTRFGRPAPEQNYLQRVAENYGQIGEDLTRDMKIRGEELSENVQNKDVLGTGRSLVRSALRPLGAVARGAFSPIEEIKPVNEAFEKLGDKISQTKFAENFADYYEEDPERAKDLLDFVDVVTLGTARELTTPLMRGISKFPKLMDVPTSRFVDSAVADVSGSTAPGAKTIDVIADKATGKTVENVGSIQKAGAGERNLLTVPEKKRLITIDPETGNRYLEVLQKGQTEKAGTAPTLLETAVKDTESAMNQYRNAVSKKGGKIGEIKTQLKTQPAPNVDDIFNDLVNVMKEKGVEIVDGKFKAIEGSNTPFSSADINAINREIIETLQNIRNADSMEQVLLGMERLDNKINYNKSDSVSGSLQGVSKRIRAKLKELRDASLPPEDAAVFADYSVAQEFMDEFFKSPNKTRVLLKRIFSENSGDTLRLAKEIERVTGIDIIDYASLYKILAETTGAQSAERSLLNNVMGGVADSILTGSPVGVAGGLIRGGVEALGKKVFNVNKLDEIKKALDFKPKK